MGLIHVVNMKKCLIQYAHLKWYFQEIDKSVSVNLKLCTVYIKRDTLQSGHFTRTIDN